MLKYGKFKISHLTKCVPSYKIILSGVGSMGLSRVFPVIQCIHAMCMVKCNNYEKIFVNPLLQGASDCIIAIIWRVFGLAKPPVIILWSLFIIPFAKRFSS